MKYYVNTIEQITADEGYAEYSKSEKVNDYQSALTKFYKKLSDVSADIGKNHTYLNITIVQSTGSVLKCDEVGTYVGNEETTSETA